MPEYVITCLEVDDAQRRRVLDEICEDINAKQKVNVKMQSGFIAKVGLAALEKAGVMSPRVAFGFKRHDEKTVVFFITSTLPVGVGAFDKAVIGYADFGNVRIERMTEDDEKRVVLWPRQ